MKLPIARTPLLVPMILLFCLLTGGWTALAQQPAQPTVDASCPYVLKSGIPFAWLRFEPSSFAGFGVTLRPSETVQPNNPAVLAWDGTQWWVYVWPNASSARGYYWVELTSIEPRCTSPTPTPSTGAAPWQTGNVVRVRFNVAFVWFRAEPAPGNPPIHTVLPGTQLTIVQGASLDNFNQWWWLMRDPRNGVTGWVEQNTVELVSGAPPPSQPTVWQVGDTVSVKLSIPFSWLRNAPSSTSGFTATARPGQYLIVQQVAVNDGVQNWWLVLIPSTGRTGWVEENSLQFVRRG